MTNKIIFSIINDTKKKQFNCYLCFIGSLLTFLKALGKQFSCLSNLINKAKVHILKLTTNHTKDQQKKIMQDSISTKLLFLRPVKLN